MDRSSGELAKLAGVSADTLRHYERVGVLPRARRSGNNYRVYPESTLARVFLIRRALTFGFSLAELTIVLKEREQGSPPCRKVRALAAVKLEETEQRLLELTRLRDELRVLLNAWDTRLRAAPQGKPAHLLESLPHETQPHAILEKQHDPTRSDPCKRPSDLSGRWRRKGRGRTSARR